MLDIQGRKYASVTVCDVTLYDLVTKYPVMFFDTLQVTSIDSTSEVTDIQGGKGNAILASVSHSKNIDVQFDDAIMTMSSLALLTGGTLEQGKEGSLITMTETEIVTAGAEGALTLSKMPKVGSYVWVAELIDGVLSTASRTDVKLTATTAKTTLAKTLFYNKPEALIEGHTYRVFYEHEVSLSEGTSTELTVLADKFAGTYRLIGDTVLFNQYTGGNDIFQIEIPKLKLDSSYSMSFNASTEAIVFSFKGKALRDDLGNMIVFRQVQSDNGASVESGDAQYDGVYRKLPAVKVTIGEDGTITSY